MTSTTKYIVVPALMVCLANMVSFNFAAETPAANTAGKPKEVPAPARDSTQETLKRMTEQLTLGEDQQKRVKLILDKNAQKMREIRANTNLTAQEFGVKAREVRAANDKQIKEILTAEQYQKWQKILAESGTRRRSEPPPGATPLPKPSPTQSGSAPTEKR
jgi:Spy/CpxP family protein refolding chaperone